MKGETMATEVHQRTYLDTWAARLVALAVAVAMFALIFVTFGDAIAGAVGLAASDDERGPSVTVRDDPALRECLARRVGDVDRMRDEGLLDERRYASFKDRAEQLCLAQNPVQPPAN